MIEWFKNLNDAEKIAIVVPVIVAVIGGLLGLLKAFGKGKSSSTQKKTFQQKGSDNVAANIGGSGNTTNVAGRDVNLGIDGDAALNQLVRVSKEAGQSKSEIKHLEEKNEKLKDSIGKLEEQLAQRQVLVGPGQQQTPQPTQEAKELAKLITQDDSPYAQALKAIAEGNNKKADGLLDETQKIIDHIQQGKDKAQAKIFSARMQNASYAGRPRDALQWCDKLKPLAGEDAQILNLMGVVYNENTMYEKAEPLMKRALAIDEASLGKDHPDVARDLNNLAQLYQDTNCLAEAEPLMKRVVEIVEKSLGKAHPNVVTALNNLAMLYQDTNRLSEAEPLIKRALAIWEKSLGENHPRAAAALNNLSALYQATNRLSEAEPLMKRALAIDEASFGKDHPDMARDLNNLATLYLATNRLAEAEPLMKRMVEIVEKSLGKDHPNVATGLNNLAQLYQATNRLSEAEPLMKRHLVIFIQFTRRTGHPHPHLKTAVENYSSLLRQMGHSKDEVTDRLKRLAPEMFKSME